MTFPDNFVLIMSKTNGKVMYHLRLSAGIYESMKGNTERSKKIVFFFSKYPN